MPATRRRPSLFGAFILLLALLINSKAWALDAYVQVNARDFKTNIDSTSFHTPVLETRLGAYIVDQIALELALATGVSDDQNSGMALKLDYQANLSARFESPESKGLKAFILLGYGLTSLDLDRNASGKPGAEPFKNGNYGIGFDYRVSQESNLFLSLAWQRYYRDGGIRIDGTGLGLTFQF